MKTKKIVFCGLFVALGVLLPQVFHMFGGKMAGAVFLPMHIPALLGGMLLGPIAGGIIGILSPFLSGILTGMPSFEKIPFMIIELATYGVVSGLLSHKLKLNSWLSLVTAMVSGRVLNMIIYFVMGELLHMQGYSYFMVIKALITGLPGIANSDCM
ncbi:MAG: ECF transporter S component [Oscillospiraceae bacterium]